MKTILITTIGLVFVAISCNAQWVTSGTTSYTNGFVGIGISAPTLPLTVVGTAQIRGLGYFTQTTPVNTLIIDATSSTAHKIYSNGTADLSFGTGGVTSQLYLQSGGNVGIGTISPSSALHVISTTNSSFAAQIINNGSTNANGLYVNIGSSSTGVPFRVDNNATELFQVSNNGNVGIGTTSPDQKLTVNGTIHSTSVLVNPNIPFPDYVFRSTYQLPNLETVKSYIDQNHHLPDMPTAAQVEKDGLNLGEMNEKLLKKVEELTLYLIEKDKAEQEQKEINKQQAAQLQSQQTQINLLIERVDALSKEKTK